MNNQTLSTVTLETIANYERAASLTLKAYRVGSSRLLDGVNQGLQTQVYSRSVKLAPNLTGAMTQLRDSLSEIIDGGLGKLGSVSERAISVGSSKARLGVKRVAAFAAATHNPLLVRSLTTAARLSLPSARAACSLSAGALEGAGRLSLLAGVPVSKAKAKAKSVVAKSVKTVETAKKTVVRAKRQVVSKVEAQVAAAPSKLDAFKKTGDEAVNSTVVAAKRRVRKAVAA